MGERRKPRLNCRNRSRILRRSPQRGSRVASILPFIRPRSDFDDRMTRVLGASLMPPTLHDSGQPEGVYEVIARRIIAAAKKGERDPVRLREIGLAALQRDRTR